MKLSVNEFNYMENDNWVMETHSLYRNIVELLNAVDDAGLETDEAVAILRSASASKVSHRAQAAAQKVTGNMKDGWLFQLLVKKIYNAHDCVIPPLDIYKGIENIVGPSEHVPEINKVYCQDGVTTILWSDRTKTQVRAQYGEKIDYEKGMAMAIAKKALKSRSAGGYYDVFKKFLPRTPGNLCTMVAWVVYADGIVDVGHALTGEDAFHGKTFEEAAKDMRNILKNKYGVSDYYIHVFDVSDAVSSEEV